MLSLLQDLRTSAKLQLCLLVLLVVSFFLHRLFILEKLQSVFLLRIMIYPLHGMIHTTSHYTLHTTISHHLYRDIHHTKNHWLNVDSMIRYLETILVPFCKSVHECLGLHANQPALLLFDFFAAYLDAHFLSALCNHQSILFHRLQVQKRLTLPQIQKKN
jgi:hypothetical protein